MAINGLWLCLTTLCNLAILNIDYGICASCRINRNIIAITICLDEYFSSQWKNVKDELNGKLFRQEAQMRSSTCDRKGHTQRNLIKSNRNQIVFTVFRSIWSQTDVHLVRNQSENGKYKLISVWLIKILKIFLCVHWETTSPRDWEKLHLLSQRLTSLGIMGV